MRIELVARRSTISSKKSIYEGCNVSQTGRALVLGSKSGTALACNVLCAVGNPTAPLGIMKTAIPLIYPPVTAIVRVRPNSVVAVVGSAFL
jgi:hypothetical protein